MTQSRFFSSVAQPNTLQSNISSSAVSIPLASAPIGYPVNTPFTIAIDYGDSIEELCDVTAVAGSVFTVTRAVDGTSAASHNVGAAIRHVSSARDFNEDNAHVNSSMGVHGLGAGSSVVGTTDTQTLTNKTFVNPSFSGTIPSLSLGVSNPIGVRPLTIQASTGQTVSNLVIQNEASTNVLGVSNTGSLLLTSADNTNQNFLQVNPSAPTATSNLLVLQNNGSNRLTVTATGQFTASYTGAANGFMLTPTTTSGGGLEVDLPSGSTANYFTGKLNGVTNTSVDANGNATFNNITMTGIGRSITALATGSGTRSSTIATIDPNLQAPLSVGTWKVTAHISYQALSGGSGIGVQIGMSSGTISATSNQSFIGPADPTVTNLNTQSGSGIAPVFGTTVGTAHVIDMSAILTVTGAGVGGLLWFCNVAGSVLRVNDVSWMTFTRIA